jgi:hypothetical protein
MKASDAFCEQPMQMDDYGMDKRHYGRHGDCTISPTYDDEDTHHCGEDVNDEDNLTS